jgi:hypothetical protein
MIKSKEMFMQMREEENSIVDYTKRNDEICSKCFSVLNKDGICIKCTIERQQKNEKRNF